MQLWQSPLVSIRHLGEWRIGHYTDQFKVRPEIVLWINAGYTILWYHDLDFSLDNPIWNRIGSVWISFRQVGRQILLNLSRNCAGWREKLGKPSPHLKYDLKSYWRWNGDSGLASRMTSNRSMAFIPAMNPRKCNLTEDEFIHFSLQSVNIFRLKRLPDKASSKLTSSNISFNEASFLFHCTVWDVQSILDCAYWTEATFRHLAHPVQFRQHPAFFQGKDLES